MKEHIKDIAGIKKLQLCGGTCTQKELSRCCSPATAHTSSERAHAQQFGIYCKCAIFLVHPVVAVVFVAGCVPEWHHLVHKHFGVRSGDNGRHVSALCPERWKTFLSCRFGLYYRFRPLEAAAFCAGSPGMSPRGPTISAHVCVCVFSVCAELGVCVCVCVDNVLNRVNRKHVHIELPGIDDVFNKHHNSFIGRMGCSRREKSGLTGIAKRTGQGKTGKKRGQTRECEKWGQERPQEALGYGKLLIECVFILGHHEWLNIQEAIVLKLGTTHKTISNFVLNSSYNSRYPSLGKSFPV